MDILPSLSLSLSLSLTSSFVGKETFFWYIEIQILIPLKNPIEMVKWALSIVGVWRLWSPIARFEVTILIEHHPMDKFIGVWAGMIPSKLFYGTTWEWLIHGTLLFLLFFLGFFVLLFLFKAYWMKVDCVLKDSFHFLNYRQKRMLHVKKNFVVYTHKPTITRQMRSSRTLWDC